MGTSSSFKGPKNNSSLLPSWADNNPDYESAPAPSFPQDGDGPATDNPAPTGPGAPNQPSAPPPQGEPSQPSVPGDDKDTPEKHTPKPRRWSDAKIAMSRFGSAPSNAKSLKNAGRSYVRARGGPQATTRSAGRGISAVAGLGGFLGDVVNRGFDEALRNAGIQDCLGKPAEEVFAKLADQLAPAGGPIDEGITRKAILDSLCYLYDKLTDENGKLQPIDALGPDEVKEALLLATQQYIYQKWLNEVGIALERKEVSEAELVDAEMTIKEFVGESVRVAFKNVNVATFSFQDPSVTQQINSIFQETYTLIEQ
ncbi:Qat anti-phage system associated protein QatB [Spirosoma pomorum]